MLGFLVHGSASYHQLYQQLTRALCLLPACSDPRNVHLSCSVNGVASAGGMCDACVQRVMIVMNACQAGLQQDLILQQIKPSGPVPEYTA